MEAMVRVQSRERGGWKMIRIELRERRIDLRGGKGKKD